MLAKQMPAAYRFPSDTANSGNLTDYVAIVGPETLWQPNHGTTFKEIKDGTSNTIAVIEAANAGIHWMELVEQGMASVQSGRYRELTDADWASLRQRAHEAASRNRRIAIDVQRAFLGGGGTGFPPNLLSVDAEMTLYGGQKIRPSELD